MLKRIKRRYLALEVDSAETFEPKDFMNAVWSAVTQLYGEHGASQTGLSLIHYEPERKFALVRVACMASDMVRAALATMTRIGDKPVTVHVIAVSGTIKAVYKNVGQMLA